MSILDICNVLDDEGSITNMTSRHIRSCCHNLLLSVLVGGLCSTRKLHAPSVSHHTACMDKQELRNISNNLRVCTTQYNVGGECMPSGVEIPPLEQIRKLNYSDPTQSSEKFILEDSGYMARRYAVPTIFRPMLDLSTIPSSRQFYWWRSQVRHWYYRYCVPTI